MYDRNKLRFLGSIVCQYLQLLSSCSSDIYCLLIHGSASLSYNHCFIFLIVITYCKMSKIYSCSKISWKMLLLTKVVKMRVYLCNFFDTLCNSNCQNCQRVQRPEPSQFFTFPLKEARCLFLCSLQYEWSWSTFVRIVHGLWVFTFNWEIFKVINSEKATYRR